MSYIIAQKKRPPDEYSDEVYSPGSRYDEVRPGSDLKPISTRAVAIQQKRCSTNMERQHATLVFYGAWSGG